MTTMMILKKSNKNIDGDLWKMILEFLKRIHAVCMILAGKQGDILKWMKIKNGLGEKTTPS